jgi:hypothetical protein
LHQREIKLPLRKQRKQNTPGCAAMRSPNLAAHHARESIPRTHACASPIELQARMELQPIRAHKRSDESIADRQNGLKPGD